MQGPSTVRELCSSSGGSSYLLWPLIFDKCLAYYFKFSFSLSSIKEWAGRGEIKQDKVGLRPCKSNMNSKALRMESKVFHLLMMGKKKIAVHCSTELVNYQISVYLSSLVQLGTMGKSALHEL